MTPCHHEEVLKMRYRPYRHRHRRMSCQVLSQARSVNDAKLILSAGLLQIGIDQKNARTTGSQQHREVD
jgi:hypothetical protein